VLVAKSARIWGVAVNDWNSASQPLGTAATPCWPQITPRNRDRGKLQVLLTSYDFAAYREAFEAGAFFAVVEDNASKAAYPTVSNVAVTYNRISVATSVGGVAVRWIGNGAVVGVGSSLSLNGLPDDLVYVRAEIDDGDGRIVYTQPFELGDPLPAPGPEISALPAGMLAPLALLLVVTVNRLAARPASRG
jgi:hypothetical protein